MTTIKTSNKLKVTGEQEIPCYNEKTLPSDEKKVFICHCFCKDTIESRSIDYNSSLNEYIDLHTDMSPLPVGLCSSVEPAKNTAFIRVTP